MNCLNPEWSKKIMLKYLSPEQKIRLEVYDIDCASTNLTDHDFLGCAELTLISLLQAPLRKRTLLLEDKK
uniref:C2 domain-containing protein n=1 Tax=Syphacia muris TaxID=451379 RepID=A0A0N5AUW2_9BILA